MLNNISKLENILKIKFNNINLLLQAVTHKSYNRTTNYETLEFLGDSIVGATVTNYVYDRFPDEEEGFMTKMKTKLVCGEMLGSLGLKMGLNEYLIISKHVEEKCNGRNSVKTMEDVFEAFIGAMYLDFNEIEIPGKMDFYSGIGFQVCETFLINLMEDKIDFADLIMHNLIITTILNL